MGAAWERHGMCELAFRLERYGTGNASLAWSVRKNRSKLRRTFNLKQDRHCTYKRNNKARSCNHCCSGNNKYYIFWVCVCRLRYPAFNAHTPYWHVTCLALQYFSTLSHKRHYLWKNLLNVKCVLLFSLQLLSETFLILRRVEQDMIKTYIGRHVKYSWFLSDFNETWIFSTEFCKIL
jgi:hypothetical protein